MAANAEALGISANTFHMVYEGFWDLYCKKPASADLTAKKLEGFVNLVNIRVDGAAPKQAAAEGEEDAAEAEPAAETAPAQNCKAILRVRVPLKRPEIVEDVEEIDDAKSRKSAKSGKSAKSSISKVKSEPVLDEIDYEDKVLTIKAQGASYNVCVVHQLVQRFAREHVAKCFKDFLPELQVLDEEEMLKTIERESEAFETEFFKNHYPDIPVFDFELN